MLSFFHLFLIFALFWFWVFLKSTKCRFIVIYNEISKTLSVIKNLVFLTKMLLILNNAVKIFQKNYVVWCPYYNWCKLEFYLKLRYFLKILIRILLISWLKKKINFYIDLFFCMNVIKKLKLLLIAVKKEIQNI